MAMVLVITLTVSAGAVQSRIISRPTLTIKNGIAYCSGTYDTENQKDKISLVLTLERGSTIIDSWSADGTCRVRISETLPVKNGKTYTLILDAKVNGKTAANNAVSANSRIR